METPAEYVTAEPPDLIRDNSNDHAYFSMMPNILDDLLGPYEYRLYAHLKRVCGENGLCFQSTNTLAKGCKMSTGRVSKAKRELERLGLIRITEKPRPGGGLPYHEITIVDIWQRNIAHCVPSSHDECASSYSEQASSPGETKKNPLKKTPQKEEEERGATAPAPPEPPAQDDPPLQEKEPEKESAAPAIRAYRTVFHSYPHKTTYGFIITAVGSRPDRVQLWTRVCTDWLLSGYNKYNVRGLIDCFHKGGVERRGNGRHDKQGGGIEEFLEIAAEYGAQERATAYGD